MTLDLSRQEAVQKAADAGIPAALADLGSLVRIPSIAWPAFDQTALVRSADAVAALLEGTGVFDSVAVRRAAIPGTDEMGQPAVLASRAARNGRPTVLLYAHHDVQPPGDEALWDSPPFEPTLRDGRLYGRGAADDKAGVMAHVGAVRAVAEVLGDDLDLGIAVFIEGEEEYGSRSFGQFLADNADALRSDVIVVADSGNWDERTPGLTVSLRGNARFTLTVRTLEHASHSGMMGGAVPDAMLATVKLLATLWDDDGAVAVEGLATRDAETPAYDEATLRAESGLLEGVSPIGRDSILSRIWNKPSITITGWDATPVEAASNTLAPQTSVVISARVAPARMPKRPSPRCRRTSARTRPSARSWSSVTSTAATPSSSTPGDGPSRRRARRSPTDTAWSRSTSASEARSPSSPTSSASSRPRRSSSPASKTPTRARTARTSPCTSTRSATRSSPRRCCWRG